MIYKIKAKFKEEKMKDFFQKLTDGTIENQKPDGQEILSSMKRAKITQPKTIEWSEMCYCSPPLKHERQTVYDNYLLVTEAFVLSDAQLVKENIKEMKNSIKLVEMSQLKGNARKTWMEHLAILNKSIDNMLSAEDIDLQRKSFATFNQTYYKTIKLFGLDNITTYYQYCPMAIEDQGAYWFSNQKEIRNPFFRLGQDAP